jgi:hypothetical protein
MPHIQLTEKIYQEAQRRAAEDGYSGVDEYIEEMVRHYFMAK